MFTLFVFLSNFTEREEFILKTHNIFYTISLDRKDSNLGYIKENIHFISIAMNHLKNSMSEENMQEILTILKTLN